MSRIDGLYVNEAKAKLEELKTVYNDDIYQILTSDQQPHYFNALKKKINEHHCKVMLDFLESETS